MDFGTTTRDTKPVGKKRAIRILAIPHEARRDTAVVSYHEALMVYEQMDMRGHLGLICARMYLQPFRHTAEDANLQIAQPSRHGLSSFGRVGRRQLPPPPAPEETKKGSQGHTYSRYQDTEHKLYHKCC